MYCYALLQINVCLHIWEWGHPTPVRGLALTCLVYWRVFVRGRVRRYHTETEQETGSSKSQTCGLTFHSPEVTRQEELLLPTPNGEFRVSAHLSQQEGEKEMESTPFPHWPDFVTQSCLVPRAARKLLSPPATEGHLSRIILRHRASQVAQA